MKLNLFFLSLIFFSPLLAGASSLAVGNPTTKFIARYIQSVNDRLETVNTERAISGNRPYCPQLSDQQISDIENLFITNPTGKGNQIVYRSLDKVTVAQFIAAAADNLGCYPTFWPTKGRSTIGGVLFNSKAYVMDHLLLRSAIADLAGHTPEDSQTLNNLLPH
jgi:hypothetical protein